MNEDVKIINAFSEEEKIVEMRDKKEDRLIKWIGVVLGILGTLGGLAGAGYGILTYEQATEKEAFDRQEALAHQKYVEQVRQKERNNKEIRDTIAEQRAAFDSALYAMVQIRLERRKIENLCLVDLSKIDNKTILLALINKRAENTYALVKAIGDSRIADFANINLKLSDYANWDEKVTVQEICSGKGPSNEEYQEKETEITLEINKIINKEEESIK